MSYTKMLSQLGVSSAHPGGYGATIKLLGHIQLQKGSKVLEIGCGTGRTACLLAQRGFDVTAIDQQSEMIVKACKRAALQGLQVNFVVGDACDLQFEEEHFDVVLVESVTNFVDAQAALSEYYRVLKPGGTLYDRELIEVKAIPPQMKPRLFNFFKFHQLLTLDEWLMLLSNTKFSGAHLDYSNTLSSDAEQTEHHDEFQILDDGIVTRIETFQKAIEYSHIVDEYTDYLGSVLLIGSK